MTLSVHNGQAERSTVSGNELRHAIGHFATGVTVVTSRDTDGRPAGTTASAVSSLSLDPALLLVCLSRRSATLNALIASCGFTVNVLAAGQDALSDNFARPGETASWDGIAHAAGVNGHPRLDGALAALDCTVHEVLEGGDHQIVIGRVEAVHVNAAASGPLLHWRGAYAALELR